MGLFKSIGNAVSGAAKAVVKDPLAVTGGIASGIPGALVGHKADDVLLGKPEAPVGGPQFDASRDAIDAANKSSLAFRKNLPAYQQGQFEGAQNVARRNLASQIQDTQRNASSRGLLYSGLEKGSEEGARSDYASKLAQARSQINQQSQQQATDMESQAIGLGQQGFNAELGQADSLYNTALAQRAQQMNILGGLGSGIGAAAGYYAAQPGTTGTTPKTSGINPYGNKGLVGSYE